MAFSVFCPVKRFFNLGIRLTPKKNILIRFLKKTRLSGFLFKEGKNEVNYGIYEGELSLRFIKQMVDLFTLEECAVRVLNKKFNLTRAGFFNNIFVFLLGGEFGGIFRKTP